MVKGFFYNCHIERERKRQIIGQIDRWIVRQVNSQIDRKGNSLSELVFRDFGTRSSSRDWLRKELEENGISKHDLGRENFLAKVWEWKEKSGDNITNQMRTLGMSCDWSRERFTMDEGLSDAVKKVFVKLYNDGMIYKDKRLVNWDPKLLTAISDLEVEQRETD